MAHRFLDMPDYVRLSEDEMRRIKESPALGPDLEAKIREEHKRAIRELGEWAFGPEHDYYEPSPVEREAMREVFGPLAAKEGE